MVRKKRIGCGGWYGAVLWAECPGRGKEVVTVLRADGEQRVEACSWEQRAENSVMVAVGQLLLRSLSQQVFSRPCVSLGTS